MRTETSSELENEQFYNDLNNNVASIVQHNFDVIAGDFNARIDSTSSSIHFCISNRKLYVS